MKTKREDEQDVSRDYVFRFKLGAIREPEDPDRALEVFCRKQIQDMLRVVVLTYAGKRVLVDGFCFLNRPDQSFELWPSGESDGVSDC